MKNRTFKRPMFRKGGPAMEGIMSGIQDRELKAGGGQIGGGSIYGRPMGNRTGYAEPRDARGLTMENIALLKELAPRPVDKDLSKMLIQGGLAALSGKGATGNTLQDVASAFQTPAAQYAEAQAKRDEYDSELGLAAAKLGIAQAGEEKIQQIKSKELDATDKFERSLESAKKKQEYNILNPNNPQPLTGIEESTLIRSNLDINSKIEIVADSKYPNDVQGKSRAQYEIVQRPYLENKLGKGAITNDFNYDTQQGFVPSTKKSRNEFLKRDDVDGVILFNPLSRRLEQVKGGKFVPYDLKLKKQSEIEKPEVEKPEVEEIPGRIPQDAIGRKKFFDALKKRRNQRGDELKKKREDKNKKIKDYNEQIRLERQLGN